MSVLSLMCVFFACVFVSDVPPSHCQWFALILDRELELRQDSRVVKYELVQTLLMHESSPLCSGISDTQWLQLHKFVKEGVHFVAGVQRPQVAEGGV